MNRLWRYLLIPAYPLLAVNALIAFLYAAFWCRAWSWKWREGVLTFLSGAKNGRTRLIGQPGGQGWSWIVGYARTYDRTYAGLRVHENVHVAQEVAWAYIGAVAALPLLLTGHPIAALVVALSGGPMFALTYAASFLWRFIPSAWGWYKVMRQNHPRWVALDFAMRQWYESYENIAYERWARERQDRYINDTSPGARERVWGHR
jgi:hypothetical protein